MKALFTFQPSRRETHYGAEALAALRGLVELQMRESEEPLGPEALIDAAANVDLIVSDYLTPAPARLFEARPRLKAFLRCAVDIRNIDVPAASRAGVLVTRVSPGFVTSVVELALGFMIDLSRGISTADRHYKAGTAPQAALGRQLAGSTAGIIGYGSIGRSLASLLPTLGMTVLVCDPHATAEDPRHEQVSFDALLRRSDYVICLAIASPQTENLMDASALSRMRPHATFINLSRGELVDEDALAAALREGRIAGAALDVGRAPGQSPSPALAGLPNVIATPHVGAHTPAAVAAHAKQTVRQVEAILTGQVPPGAVNADAWTRRP